MPPTQKLYTQTMRTVTREISQSFSGNCTEIEDSKEVQMVTYMSFRVVPLPALSTIHPFPHDLCIRMPASAVLPYRRSLVPVRSLQVSQS